MSRMRFGRANDGARRYGRRLARGCLAIGVLATSTVLGTTDASAALTDCPSNRVCTWTNTSYSGTPNATFVNNIVYGAANNTSSSVNNNLAVAFCFYDSSSYTGFLFSMGPFGGASQWRDPALSNGVDANPTNFDNRVSSAKVC